MGRLQYPVLISKIGDLSVRSVLDGGFFRESEMAHEVHVHAFYELMIGISGEFVIELRDSMSMSEPLVMRRGSVCLIPPGVYHSTRELSEAPSKLALRFSYTPVRSTPDGSLFESFSRAIGSCTAPLLIADGGRIYRIVCELREEIASATIASDEYVTLLLNQLYVSLLRSLTDADRAQKQDTFSPPQTDELAARQLRIEEFMAAHLSDALTEEDLAREMNLSKRQLSRVLRRLFGMSFRRMLIDMRLHRAAQLLIDTDMPIEEIATAVGYTSLSGFYTAFRERFSVSAGRYRARFGK